MPRKRQGSQPRRLVTRHQVRDRLVEMILSGERPPGTKLVQQPLARRFGVAQGVVREALLELQAYGLVNTIDNRGVFVSELSPKTLLDAFEVREIHEGLAARLCCERTSRSEIRELVDITRQIYALASKGQSMEAALLDRELHQRIVHLSGNTMLIRLADNYRHLGKVIQLTRDPEQVRDDHLAILEAIQEGRTDDAERLMRQHIRVGREAASERIMQGQFIPRWLMAGTSDDISKDVQTALD